MNGASENTVGKSRMGLLNADSHRQGRRRRMEQTIALISLMRNNPTINVPTVACALDVSETTAAKYLRTMLEHDVATVARRKNSGAVMAYALLDDAEKIAAFITWLGDQTREAEAAVLKRRQDDMVVEQRVVDAKQVGMPRDPLVEALFGPAEADLRKRAAAADGEVIDS